MPSTPSEILMSVAFGYLGSQALHVVTKLGVAEVLSEGPATAEEIGVRVGVVPDVLHRTLRLLEVHGVFTVDGDGVWAHTANSEPLAIAHPRSIAAFFRMMSDLPNWGSSAALEHSLRTGEPGGNVLHPDGFFHHLATHPEKETLFGDAMRSKAQEDIPAVLAARDFAAWKRVVDVGGGGGHLAAAIVDTTGETAVTVFDLPGVAARLSPSDRLAVVSGDFFTDPLPEGDAYVLMNIIHDWEDGPATTILAATAAAAERSGATVLVIETLLPEGPEPHPAKALDVLMIGTTGGRERTLGAYSELLRRGGLELVTVTETAAPVSIIEARAVPDPGAPEE